MIRPFSRPAARVPRSATPPAPPSSVMNSRRPIIHHLVGKREQLRRNFEPSAFAVLVLITSSNFVARIIGRSPAFPLYDAASINSTC